MQRILPSKLSMEKQTNFCQQVEKNATIIFFFNQYERIFLLENSREYYIYIYIYIYILSTITLFLLSNNHNFFEKLTITIKNTLLLVKTFIN